MLRLKPKANLHSTTNTNCGSQRELTAYSFQPYLTAPVRSSTSGRLMPPARSRWPKAVLVSSNGICHNKTQSVPSNTISFTLPLFTTHRVPKEVQHWQMATNALPAATIGFRNRNKLVGKATCNRCQGYNQRATCTPPLPQAVGRNVNLRPTHSNHIRPFPFDRPRPAG